MATYLQFSLRTIHNERYVIVFIPASDNPFFISSLHFASSLAFADVSGWFYYLIQLLDRAVSSLYANEPARIAFELDGGIEQEEE
jgi:hypothetical protein